VCTCTRFLIARRCVLARGGKAGALPSIGRDQQIDLHALARITGVISCYSQNDRKLITHARTFMCQTL
jgi:hypothetical protein